MEALGQQPVPDENADAVMGAHSNGEIISGFFTSSVRCSISMALCLGSGLDQTNQSNLTLGVGGIERRHSSTEGGSFRGEPVVKITVNR